MSEMNNRSTYDFAAALRGEELKEATELTPEPTRPSYDFAAMLRQAEEPVLGGPTADEAEAGLAAAEAAGEGTQVLRNGEVVIPPAREPEEEEVEERIQNRLVDWLKDVDWKNAAKQGALMLGPAIFSGVLWETMPQLHQALESFVGGGMIGGVLAEGLIGALSQAEKIHPRFAGLARVAAARRGTGFLIAQMAASAGIGIVGAEGLDRFFQAHAVQSTIVGGSGEGSVDPTISAPTHGSNVDSTGYYHGVSDVNLPQPSETVAGDFGGLQPPADVTSASEATQQAVQDAAQQAEAAAQAAAEQAAAAAAQQAEALRQTTLEALNQGKTVAQVMQDLPKDHQTISDALYQMVGNIPHRMETVLSLMRSLRTAGVDLVNLHEGTIQAGAKTLTPVFEQAHQAATSLGIPYTEGGLSAVQTLIGQNSDAARAVESANLPGMNEAAAQVFQNVVNPAIHLALGK